MNVTCPACGADMSLDVLLAHEDSRLALASLCLMSVPLASQVMRYVGLFRPGKRQMSHSRVATLIGELVPDMQRGAITRNGREWPAPLEIWRTGFERMLEARDKGALQLPLKSHGYLYEVLSGIADKAEAEAERAREADRRIQRSHTAGSESVGELVQRMDTALARAGQAAQRLAEPPKGPSAYARRLQAEIQARQQRGADSSDSTPRGAHRMKATQLLNALAAHQGRDTRNLRAGPCRAHRRAAASPAPADQRAAGGGHGDLRSPSHRLLHGHHRRGAAGDAGVPGTPGDAQPAQAVADEEGLAARSARAAAAGGGSMKPAASPRALSSTCALCRKPIGAGRLLCPPHWHQVPENLQREVNRTWNTFRRLHPGESKRQLQLLREYRSAREAALASLSSSSDDTNPEQS